eukprot:TRINITY_DN1568_c0_g1_i3.p2 TRINITY_DN1568_c0_g1~~TRINITY_DN1568_c0_g1_i3.p2  ORF type:complete len:219 (+),score=-14.62 TRINITY_DN1568_c0_g1_i3:1221-1877(+)
MMVIICILLAYGGFIIILTPPPFPNIDSRSTSRYFSKRRCLQVVDLKNGYQRHYTHYLTMHHLNQQSNKQKKHDQFYLYNIINTMSNAENEMAKTQKDYSLNTNNEFNHEMQKNSKPVCVIITCTITYTQMTTLQQLQILYQCYFQQVLNIWQLGVVFCVNPQYLSAQIPVGIQWKIIGTLESPKMVENNIKQIIYLLRLLTMPLTAIIQLPDITASV